MRGGFYLAVKLGKGKGKKWLCQIAQTWLVGEEMKFGIHVTEGRLRSRGS